MKRHLYHYKLIENRAKKYKHKSNGSYTTKIKRIFRQRPIKKKTEKTGTNDKILGTTAITISCRW